MWLQLSVVVCCFLRGSSDVSLWYAEKCYGESFKVPERFASSRYQHQLYIGDGEEKTLLVDNGKAVHPRIKIDDGSIYLTDLRQSDDGQFSTSYNGIVTKATRLKILDCAELVKKHYGDKYDCPIPRKAEYLEFTPLTGTEGDDTVVLWNRSDPLPLSRRKSQVKEGKWLLRSVVQRDSGHYNFRSSSNNLLSRVKLIVEATTVYRKARVEEQMYISNPIREGPWTLKFTREGESEPILLIDQGQLVNKKPRQRILGFTDRLDIMMDGLIEVSPVLESDSGTFEFIDDNGITAQTVELTVIKDSSFPVIYIGIAVGIFIALFGCCCLMRKCCCRKESAPVLHTYNQNVAADSGYTAAPGGYYSYEPGHPVVNRFPATPSHGQSVAAPQEQGPPPPFSPNMGSLDPEPRFELKGLNMPSAPPLGSESAIHDVYTSDKLNFL